MYGAQEIAKSENLDDQTVNVNMAIISSMAAVLNLWYAESS